VKKLQIIRTFIKAMNMDKDCPHNKQKLTDMKKQIEVVMHNFRDHERDYKQMGYKFTSLLPDGFNDDMEEEDIR
jgi:hypothetical protein